MRQAVSRIACALLLAPGLAGPAAAQNPPVTVTIDAAAQQRTISPFIYGVAGASAAELADLNAPLNRYGGNNATRYNWQQNADNRGFDWYFESIAEASATPGERGDRLIAADKGAGAESMITLPMIDWVAKVGPGRAKLAGFSQAKYGAQTDADWSWFPDAGNGILAGTGQPVVGNDPNDANVPNGVALQQGWVQHLVGRWGAANSGGLRYYVLDNEHSIWFSTHRDVQPVGPTMEQIRQKMIDYAAAIKAVDPAAQVVGPEEWGWSGYLLSGYDQQWGAQHGWGALPDRTAHGNMDYLPWLLAQLRQHDQANGTKSLDVFSVHYYPQGGEFSDSVSSTMQQRRNRSTRSLWDPNYVDETWIGDTVMLLPRLKNWVAAHYPGLKTAITEYNWGAENHINGATTQADVLGLFGREGLDYAALWTTPAASTPTYKAMKLYRNYDGGNSGFGNTSVAAGVPNPDTLSAFAALRAADGALTVMVVNKALTGVTPVSLALANFSAASAAQAWQLTSANAITRLADVAVAGASLAASVPPQSITLFVIPAAAPAAALRTHVSGAGSDANVAHACNAAHPCRSFAAALGVTAAGGEILALDSAGYGKVAIDRSVSIVAAPGVFAGIGVGAGGNATGVDIAAAGVNVVLRGLTVTGQGGSHGIRMTGGAALAVENCVIAGFGGAGQAGIRVSAAAAVRVADSMLRENRSGIVLSGGATASVSRSRFHGGEVALEASDAGGGTTSATIERSLAEGTTSAFVAHSAAGAAVRLFVTDSTVAHAGTGVLALHGGGGAAEASVRNSLLAGNGHALRAQGPGARLLASGNTVTGNFIGLEQGAAAVLESDGSNRVRANGTDSIGSISPFGKM